MEQIGFIFGSAGLTFALIAWEKLNSLRKEFESLKKELEETGTIKVKLETDNK